MGTAKPANAACTGKKYGVCLSGSCQCYQNLNSIACTPGGAPTCLSWGFESGTTDLEGWGPDPRFSPGNGVTNITISTAQHHTGASSLAVTIAFGSLSTNGAGTAGVIVPLCASNGTLNLAGYTFSAWVLFSTIAGAVPGNAANLLQAFTTNASPGSVIDVEQFNLNQWLHLQGPLVGSPTAESSAGLNVEFALQPSEGWSGTMFVDDVQITPP
jgi:hypothetical protein